jgi:hypothetical protein
MYHHSLLNYLTLENRHPDLREPRNRRSSRLLDLFVGTGKVKDREAALDAI